MGLPLLWYPALGLDGSEETMGNTLVNYITEDGIAVLTLTDPPMNAVTHEMMKDLDEAILEARFDNDVHLIIIAGHGDWFSGGVDVQMLPEVDSAYSYYFGLHANETLTRIENTPKLTIAAMNGHAIGMGLEIALACDLRVARKGSGNVSMPDVKLGLVPWCGGALRAARLMGRSQALRLAIEGRSLTFDEAHELGLVDHVWEARSREALLTLAIEYGRAHVPPDGASHAVGAIKRILGVGADLPLDQGLAFERELHARLFSSVDAAEGIRAYLDKRKPQFQGR